MKARVALGIGTVIGFAPALGGSFVWDDDRYVTPPALRSLGGLWRIWTVPGAAEQYYPALHTAFWIQERAWGLAPFGYHLVSLLSHLLGALLFGAVLRRLAVPGAWLAAAVFALHPVHVSSVAWIAEQKNTLSLAWFLAAVLAYLSFDGTRRLRHYAVACACFVAAVLTKTNTAVLPVALLVVFWWKRGRIDLRRDVAPLAPWVAFGGVAAWLASWVERHFIGAEGMAFSRTALEKGVEAGRAFWTYLGHLLFPVRLGFVYPRWHVDPAGPPAWFGVAGVVAAGAAAWAVRRWSRAPLAGFLLYGILVGPVLGFVTLYGSLYSRVWDHWQYLPDLVPIAALGAAAAWAVRRQRRPASLAVALVLLVLGISTFARCEDFHDGESLYRSGLVIAPDSWMLENNLAILLKQKGRIDEALPHFRRAVELEPQHPEAVENNWGIALAAEGRYADAIAHYEAALRLRPGYPDALHNIGASLVKSGQPERALPYFKQALNGAPSRADYRDHYASVLNDLGIAKANAGRYAEAAADFAEVVSLRPDSGAARDNLRAAQEAGKGMAPSRGP